MMNMKAKKTRRYSWWKLRGTCRSWHGCFSNVVILLLIVDISTSTAAGATTNTNNNQKFDWLIHQNPTLTKSIVLENICWRDYYESTDGDDDDGVENVVCGIELTNNLITRRFALIEEENNGVDNSNEEAKTSNFCFGTIDILMYDSLSQAGGISMLRSIEPEANLVLNGQHYIIGDLQYQSGFRAYLNRTNLRNNLDCARDGSNTTFRYKNHRIIPNMTKPFEWTPGTRHSMPNLHWPPKGIGLEIDFELSATANIISQERGESRGRIDNHIVVTVHYEIYDTIPVMSKWISISSPTTSSNFAGDEQDYSRSSFKIDSVTVERIASFPPYSSYAYENGASAPYTLFDGEANGWSAGPPPQLVSLTDQAHGTKCRWINDYESSNNTNPTTNETYHDYGATEPLLICNYTLGPSITVNDMVDAGGGRYNDNETSSTTLFTSFRSILLATDSIEPERYSLMQHRMHQILLPHTTENPLYFHAIVEDGDAGQQQFETIVDQMMEVGFEMLVYSFGSSGFQLETSALQPNNNQSMMTKIRDQVRYAKSKGIEEVGGYDLICLQRGHGGYGQNIPDEWARTSTAIDPKTGQQSLSEDACFASEWYNHLLYDILLKFINFTDISMLVLDGPYGGSSCSSTNHSHHDGLEDSMYQQTQHQDKFLLTLRNMGIYLNIPDSYFFSGSNRIGIGYDEFQYSLPRWEQLTITRMGLYDDLYRYLPTQGWMFIPIGEYHGGGAGNDATFADHPVGDQYSAHRALMLLVSLPLTFAFVLFPSRKR